MEMVNGKGAVSVLVVWCGAENDGAHDRARAELCTESLIALSVHSSYPNHQNRERPLK